MSETSNLPVATTGESTQAKPVAKDATAPRANETGDLTSQVDFYGASEGVVPLEDNNPNVDWEGPGNQGDGDEGEDPAGEVAASEEAEGEGEGDSEDVGEGETEADGEGDEEGKKDEKKTLVRIGDTDYDLPLTATMPVPVNGEIENPTIQEMRDAYSAKSSIRKELEQSKAAKQEITTHRRKMLRDVEKKEVELIEKSFTVNKGRELLKEGNFEAALNEFFEYDPDKWDTFDGLMVKYYTQFARLQPAEQRALQLDRKNKMTEVRHRLATEATAMQAEINAFNAFKEQSCTAAGIEEELVEDAWDEIVDRANKGGYTKQQVDWLNKATPHEKWNTAMSEALAIRTQGKITDVIKKQFPKLENKSKDIIKELEEKLSAKFLMKATKEEIAMILVRDYNGGNPGKTPGKKVAPTNSLGDKAQPRHKLREAATQEDLDDIYDQSGRDEPSNQVWGSQFHK